MENNQLAFSMAEQHLGISSLINPAEMESPDRLALVTYLSLFYELFHGSQPVTLPTGAEHDSKAKKPKVSHENSTISTKKSATSEVISTETSTSIKKPTSTTEKQVTSTEKLKSTEQSFTSSRKPSEEQASSDKKLVSVATSSTSSQKPVTSPEKQVSSSQKPFTSSEKHVTSAEKFKSVEKSSQKPLEKQVTSAEKPSSVEKSSRKLFISSIVSTENQASSAETQATSTSRQVTTIEKPGTPAEKLVEKVASAEKCTTSAETEQVETPPKKKSKKRKFRLFRRNKKKSLATATPSIERYRDRVTSKYWFVAGGKHVFVLSVLGNRCTLDLFSFIENGPPKRDQDSDKGKVQRSNQEHPRMWKKGLVCIYTKPEPYFTILGNVTVQLPQVHWRNCFTINSLTWILHWELASGRPCCTLGH